MSDDTSDPVDALLESAVARFLSGESVEIESIIAGNPGHAAALRSRWAAIQRLRDPFGPMLQSVAAPVSPIAAGAHIGEYEIVREIGRGGMGIVYEAMQKHPRRPVALKVIRGSAYVDFHAVRMFQREIAALARLKHPGIAAIYGAGATEDGRHFFAMELVQGVPLLDYVRENKLTRKQQLELFIRICEAVNYAHQRGVIHRDLKPGNILVEAGGNPKVLDFGLARVTDADMNVTTAGIDAGRILGTLPYMSPEQVQGRTDEVDIRTDVYSLGVILYQLLTRRMPHELEAISIPQAIRNICDDTPRQPSVIDSSLRGDLQTVMLKSIDKTPGQRYASAGEFAADIDRFLNDLPIEARPASARYQITKFVKRNRLVASVVFASFLGLTTYAISVSILSSKFLRERDRAIAAESQAAEARDRVQKERDTALAAKEAEAAERKRAQAAEGQAQSLLSRSEEINEFLVYLFGIPRLNSVQPAQNTAKAVLDEGRSIVTRKGNILTDGTRAALLETLGRCYSGQGEFRTAEKLLREAVKMNEDLVPVNDKRRTSALLCLATVLNERQRYAEAKEIASEAVSIGRAHRPQMDAQLIHGLVVLGEANRQGLSFAPQLQIYDEAYRLSKQHYGAADLAGKRAAIPYGIALLESGRAKDAADVFAGITNALGALENFSAARVLIEQVGKQMATGELDFDTLEALAESSITLGENYAARDDPQILKIKLWLAGARAVNGNSRRALEMLKSLVPVLEKKFGEGDQQTLLAKTVMGEAMVCLRDYQEAESLLTQVLDQQIERLGPDHPDLCRTYGGLANIHARWARFGEAENCLNKVLVIRRKNLSKNHAAIAATIGQIGALRLSEGRLEEAAAKYQEALEIHDRSAIRIPLLRNFFRLGIAGCKSERGNCDEATAAAVQLLSEVDESRPNNCLQRAISLLIQSDCSIRMGNPEKAIELANQAIALQAKAGDWGTGIRGEALVYIGIAQIRLDNKSLGQAALRSAIDELKAFSTPQHLTYKRALDELGKLEKHE